MKKDIDEMARMLEAYLAFARGDLGESAAPTDMAAFLEDQGRRRAQRPKSECLVSTGRRSSRCGRPRSNVARQSGVERLALRLTISITGHRDHRYLSVTVDDDGPGIAPDMREEVFKPFLRLDDARNQDEGDGPRAWGWRMRAISRARTAATSPHYGDSPTRRDCARRCACRFRRVMPKSA